MTKIDQEEVSRRRGIYFQSFGIYGGASGFYDYGPYGSKIKDKIVKIWKREMLSEGATAEYDGTSITHPDVLKASGHYERFFDYVATCTNCGASYRADDLIERKGLEAKPDREWLNSRIRELNIRCEKCGNELGEVGIKKLMFEVNQGDGLDILFLRPETAQGIFINFKEYYRFFREKLPFAIIQVGRGYRNEISPRRALFRLREFNMMECESFFDPDNEMWVNEPDDMHESAFLSVAKGEIKATANKAYKAGIVKSQPMAYFMGLSLRYYSKVGIDLNKVRFRQHRKEELSHYSSETWDAEALTDLGWIEITGITHRGTFDISNHIKYSGKDLYAQRIIPRRQEVRTKREIDYRKIKEKFRKDSSLAINALKEGLSSVEINGKNISLERFVRDIEETVVVDRESFIPTVIEPSYGVDRIIYALLDHNLAVREASGYNYLRIPPAISPYDAAVLPLMDKDGLNAMGRKIFQNLLDSGVEVIFDDSGSIGKRYSRYDEVGIVYCLTIDFDSLKNGDVTLRHRDTMNQIRIMEKDILSRIKEKPWDGKEN